MRQIRFTLGQMGLVVILVVGVAASILAAVERVLPRWYLPWLLPLLAVVAFDAVATERVVRRQRLGLHEQGALRASEALLLVVLVRLASLTAENASFHQLMQPWLRDPLAFFGGSFGLYLLPSLLVWIVTTIIVQSVLQFETELPRLDHPSLPGVDAVVVEDRAVALAQFDRYWLVSALLALVAATVALRGISLAAALADWRSARPVLAVFGVLLAGLLLHSQGQFNQLSYGWVLGQVAVAPEVHGRSRRAGTLLTAFALFVGIMLGGVMLLVPPPPLIPLLNVLLVVSTLLLALVIALLSLLLLPLAWLFSLLTGGTSPTFPAIPSIPPAPITQVPTERPLLPALIFWLCVIFLVGIGVLRYLQQRYDVLSLVGRWRGVRWLLRFLAALWSDTRAWSAYALQTVQLQLSRRSPNRRQRLARLPGGYGQLRALYERLVHAGARHGVGHSTSQTPYEFGSTLERAFPTTAADVAAITEAYVAAEYGPDDPAPLVVRRARWHWRRIARGLRKIPHDGSRKHLSKRR